jgi:hypothetical protein
MSDINSQRNEPGKSLAIAFYEKEHILQPDERKQLHKFFKGLYDRISFSLVLCYGIASGILLLMRKTEYKRFESYILCFLLACASHWSLLAKLCELHLEKFRRDVEETSNIFETVKVTPDPIRNSGFLSKYFKNSSDNPNMRMRDPRRITDSFSHNPFEEKLGQIEAKWLEECDRFEQSSVKDKMSYIWCKRTTRKEKNQAIAFYEREHILQSNERKQLSEFFNGQSDVEIYSYVSCMAVCTGVPFALELMKFTDSSYPIFGTLTGTISFKLITNQLYSQSLEKFKKSVGETSNVFRTVQVTPDFKGKKFWSNYFKDSSENPNIRMRDPRSITDLSNYILIEEKLGKIQEKDLEECNRSE